MRKLLILAFCVVSSFAFAADTPAPAATDYMARAVLRCIVGQEQYVDRITELQNELAALKKAQAASQSPDASATDKPKP